MQKSILLILALIVAGATAQAQSDEWHESEHWKLYNILPGNFKVVRGDALDRYQSRPLEEDLMRGYMAHPTRISATAQPVLHKAYLATCDLDEVHRIVYLSTDGTFFYDDYAKAFYRVAPEIQKEWAAYLAACMRSMRDDKGRTP